MPEVCVSFAPTPQICLRPTPATQLRLDHFLGMQRVGFPQFWPIMIPAFEVHLRQQFLPEGLISQAPAPLHCLPVRFGALLAPPLLQAQAKMPGAYIGPAAKATAAYLRYQLNVPDRKISQLFSDFFGLRFVPASAYGFERQAVRRGLPLYEDLRQKIRALPVVHADETSWRHDGQAYWVWYAGDDDLAFMRKIVQGTRSDQGLQNHSVLRSLFGTARRQVKKPHQFFLNLFTKTTARAQAALYRKPLPNRPKHSPVREQEKTAVTTC